MDLAVREELIEGRIRRHDRNHFEVKLDYPYDSGVFTNMPKQEPLETRRRSLCRTLRYCKSPRRPCARSKVKAL